MIEIRYYIKKDGTTELQYRQVILHSTDRHGLSGQAHFTASEWKPVPIVREDINGRS
jgi:hypothetical protein